MEQRSEEWFQARLGKVTASKISDVLMKPTTAGYRNYRAQLVAERLTNTKAEMFCSDAMQRGTELEPDARACYEFITGNTVVEVGLVDHPTIKMSGASPDGIIGDIANDYPVGAEIGLVEIKCPNTANHIDYLTSGKAPAQYINQMQWQMACTGAMWCDFVSYDPRLPENLQIFITRVERDNKKIEAMEASVISFLKEVDDMVEQLEQINGAKAA